MLSRLYYAGLRATGITAIARRYRNGGVILCYHNVVGRPGQAGDPAVHMPLGEFERQLRWIADRYNVLPLLEFNARLQVGESMRHTAALTFDDGYAGVFEHAWPLLRAATVPATVFIPTGCIDAGSEFWWDHPTMMRHATPQRRQLWLEDLRGERSAIARTEGAGACAPLPAEYRPATWDAIRRAAGEGFLLGAHSASHRNLTRLSDDELEQEIAGSRSTLESRTGVRVESFAYPYGLWNARVHDFVQQAGFRVGVTLDGGLNAARHDAWSLRRVNVPSSISAPAFEAWVGGLQPSFKRTR